MTCFNIASVSRPVLFFIFLALAQQFSVTQGKKTTHLHFYLHEFYSGPNSTTLTVVNPGNSSSYVFGGMAVIDDMLKEGPDPNSKLIGRVQGMVSISSMEKDKAILTMFNFVFTDGNYNGSTLAVFGRAAAGSVIERPVVGGTGVFRMAQGYTISKQLPSPKGLMVLEFDAYISHKKIA